MRPSTMSTRTPASPEVYAQRPVFPQAETAETTSRWLMSSNGDLAPISRLRAESQNHGPHSRLDWLGEAIRTVTGPAEEMGQRQDVIRRALLAPVIVALVLIPPLRIPGWPAVAAACGAAFLYDIPLAYIVFVKKRFLLARALAFVLDALLLAVASFFVLRALGSTNSSYDLWLAFLLFVASGGFFLAPVGALIYTGVAMVSFALGTVLYFPADSQYQEQLLIRLFVFA